MTNSQSQGRIADIEACRKGLLEIIAAMQPMTVRQLFYQAVVRGLFHKTEYGYNRVQTDCVVMRKTGELPYEWLEDNTRAEIRPTTFDAPPKRSTAPQSVIANRYGAMPRVTSKSGWRRTR